VRALIAAACIVLLGATVSALVSDRPASTFAVVVVACAALLAIPFTIAGVVHARAQRRRTQDRAR
jgi:hypothetical protein